MSQRNTQSGKGKGANNIGGSTQQSQHGGSDHGKQMGDKSHTGAGAKDHTSKGHSTK